MLTKQGDKPIGKCKTCHSEVYLRNKKMVCNQCGEISKNNVELRLYPSTLMFSDKDKGEIL